MNTFNDGGLNKQVSAQPINLEQATNLIIEHAKQLVNKAIETRGNNRPPFLSAEYARLIGIKSIVKANLGKTSGLLLRFRDGPIIKVNQNQNFARQNFSCAHEIGHILFSELKLENYIRSIEYRTFNPRAKMKVRMDTRERLCDAAAAELLMPESIFIKYILNFGLSISVVERMAEIFQVSLGAAVKRISEVSTEPCIGIVWRLQKFGDNLKPFQISGPKKNEKYLPKNIDIKKPSLLHQTYDDHIPVKSNYKFFIGNEEKSLFMESKGFGFKDFKCVVSLAKINT